MRKEVTILIESRNPGPGFNFEVTVNGAHFASGAKIEYRDAYAVALSHASEIRESD